MANLNEKCITSNHRSTEYYLDQVGLGSIPNIVVINISLRQSTQFDPPSYSETGYGYWRVKGQKQYLLTCLMVQILVKENGLFQLTCQPLLIAMV